jgi:hypothetical protein|tara:strand:- start:41863 stop:41982 length:120 start_codon:yes stop_codon:yes gene_type:complete
MNRRNLKDFEDINEILDRKLKDEFDLFYMDDTKESFKDN